ncbi:UNVERIFIED_CONTAM: hypothetical protein PYX00_004808 [Menopon gallinae]|uniref:Carboxylic ester hydrolase n=1 Tax=Menopon gallinae TaxID=328185 RepID=A0AAW2I7X6_9NEOP
MFPKLWVFVLVHFFAAAFSDEEPNIRVEEGLLGGKWMTSRSGRQFMGFFRVPYAAPPVGELRFEVPQQPRKWEGVRNATEDGAVCAQRDIYVKGSLKIEGEEDCLYLNVYTPKVNTTSDLLPVMVFFHGGGWVTGSGNSMLYPPEYLLDKDIVLVSIQYRLGPLGFLSMEDEELPGNLGLKDQVQSLKWIQKNIKSFGGNPDLVTIFGESAGGASVHYHVLSPMSKGLFHRAILQSGTATCPWALAEPGVTRNNTVKLAELLECPSSTTKDLVKCLREKPFEDILMTDVHFLVWNKDPIIPFKPVLEKSAGFIVQPAEEVIKSGNFPNVPMMMGLNSVEGALAAASFFDNETLVKEFDEKFNELVPLYLLPEPREVSGRPGGSEDDSQVLFGRQTGRQQHCCQRQRYVLRRMVPLRNG